MSTNRYDTGYGEDNDPRRGKDQHIGGHKNICPSCSNGAAPRRCLFYHASGRLTRYAFSCGYLERRQDASLSMEHNVFIISGLRDGKRIYETFDTIGRARKFFNNFPKKVR